MITDLRIKLLILFFLNGSVVCIGQNNMGTLEDTNSGHQKIQTLYFDKNRIKDNYFTIKDTSVFKIDTLKEIFNGDTIEDHLYYSRGKIIRKERYKNEKLKSLYEYKNVQLNGIAKNFHDDSKLSDYRLYNNGEIMTWISFYESGMIKFYRIDDTLKKIRYAKEYYESGKLNNEVVTDLITGKAHEVYYWGNGKIMHDDSLFVGKRKRIIYNGEGKMTQEFSYIDIEAYLVGEFNLYYDNGKPKFQWIFKDANSCEEANYRIGTWSWWNEKGNLIKQEIYKDNELIETKEYLPEVKEQEK